MNFLAIPLSQNGFVSKLSIATLVLVSVSCVSMLAQFTSCPFLALQGCGQDLGSGCPKLTILASY